MSAAAGTLKQSCHSLWAADLNYPINGREINAKVETRCADDATQPAITQGTLNKITNAAIERAMVKCDDAGPVWPGLQNGLIPKLRL